MRKLRARVRRTPWTGSSPALQTTRVEEAVPASDPNLAVPLQGTAVTAAATPPSPHRSVAVLRPILEVLKEMNSERNLRRLITMILDTMIRYSNAKRGSIGVIKGDRFNAELSRTLEGAEIPHSDLAALRTILKMVSDTGEVVVVDDARRDPRVCDRFSETGTHPYAILALPLRVKSRLIGAIYLDNTQTSHAFGPRHREFAQILTDHAAIAIENALLHRHTTRDRTTDLSNHPHFEVLLEGELERARRLGCSCALLMVDVDDFKGINDRYGHPVGSDVLRRVAGILTRAVRGIDLVGRGQGPVPEPVVARYGGDEFEIALPGASREGALQAARRLVASVSSGRFVTASGPIRLTISVGIAVYPDDAIDAQELLFRADEALYEGKRAGKGRAVLCPARKGVPETEGQDGVLPGWMERC